MFGDIVELLFDAGPEIIGNIHLVTDIVIKEDRELPGVKSTEYKRLLLLIYNATG